MNVPAPIDPLQKRKARVISTVFGISLVFGALLVISYPQLADPSATQAIAADLRVNPLNFAYQIATIVLCFWWLNLDSRQLEIRRPWWLNLGVVLLTTVFVAYYLYMTRQPGQRAGALLAFLGVIAGTLFSAAVGMTLALMFGVGPDTASAPAI